jgi:hypothetical protein
MLEGAKLKVERAEKHIHELRDRLHAFFATDYYSLGISKNPKTGKHVLKFEITESLPPDIYPILGDALHNLHSALDLAISDAVFMKTQRRFKHLKFPIYPDKQGFENGIAKGKIQHSPEEIIALLKDAIKPYTGGNDAFWALHDLDITDKHIELIEIDKLSAMISVDVEDDRGNRVLGTFIASTGETPIHWDGIGEIHIKNHSHPAPNVLFVEGLPTQGQPVIPALLQFAELVSSVIEAFEFVLRP